ncbi:MAG: site-specific integrase [archaeon]
MKVVSSELVVSGLRAVSVREVGLWFELIFNELSEGKIKTARKSLNAVYKKRFKNPSTVKYGNMNKGFTDNELQRFFNCFYLPKEEKQFLAFLMQAYLGLRGGEVVRVRREDINFEEKQIRITTSKAGTHDILYLHDRVRIPLFNWCEKHKESIEKKKGFVFFSSNPTLYREHICSAHLRNKFREIARRANLDGWYCEADDPPTMYRKGKRKLHRLSSHSLRHYYITQVYRKTLNPIVTKKLARHQDLSSTQIYINTAKEELEDGLKKTFEEEEVRKSNSSSEIDLLLEALQKVKAKIN